MARSIRIGHKDFSSSTSGDNAAVTNASQHVRPFSSLIGPFQVRSLLHEAGQSLLYDSFDPKHQRPLLIQVITVADQRRSDVLMEEAKGLFRLRHDAIAEVVYVGIEHDDLFIAFARTEGATLASLLATRRTSTSRLAGGPQRDRRDRDSWHPGPSDVSK